MSDPTFLSLLVTLAIAMVGTAGTITAAWITVWPKLREQTVKALREEIVELLRRTFGEQTWRLVVHDPSTPAIVTPEKLDELEAAELVELAAENGHPTAPTPPTPDRLA